MSSVLFLANTDWYIFNFRYSLVQSARECGLTVTIVTPTGEYGQRLRDNGFAWRGTRIFGTRRSLASRVVFFVGCLRTVLSQRPNVIHAFTIECVVYASLLALVLRKRAVYSLVGLGYLRESSGGFRARTSRWMLRLVLRGLWRFQSRFVVTVQNEEDQATLVDGKIVSESRVYLIHGGSGADLDRFRPPDGVNKRGTPRVMFAARLLWQKGIGDFIEAAQLLAESGVHYEYWVAGAPDYGNPGSVNDAEIELWSARGIVNFLGHRDDMDWVLKQVDLVVLPTYYGEGVPRILIEAAATGLPIVATNHIGCRAVVQDGENGRLVPTRDPIALSKAIEEILGDSALCSQMGCRSREIAESSFDERSVIAEILDRYAELE